MNRRFSRTDLLHFHGRTYREGTPMAERVAKPKSAVKPDASSELHTTMVHGSKNLIFRAQRLHHKRYESFETPTTATATLGMRGV
jgi:hypothetical protein